MEQINMRIKKKKKKKIRFEFVIYAERTHAARVKLPLLLLRIYG